MAECGDALELGAEARQEGKRSGKSSTTAPERGVNGFSYGPTARGYDTRAVTACAACGVDVAASDQQLARSADSAGMRWQLWFRRSWRGQDCYPTGTVAMGQAQITVELIFQYSKYLQILKYKTNAILMLKNIQTWHGGRFEHSEQFFPLGRLPIPNIIHVTNFGINSNLNLP
jgi:hypothetical protein